MLKAGTDLDDFTAEQLVNLDAKSLDKDSTKICYSTSKYSKYRRCIKKKRRIRKCNEK